MFGHKKLSHEQVLEHMTRLPKLKAAFERKQASHSALQAVAETHAANVAEVKDLGGKL